MHIEHIYIYLSIYLSTTALLPYLVHFFYFGISLSIYFSLSLSFTGVVHMHESSPKLLVSASKSAGDSTRHTAHRETQAEDLNSAGFYVRMIIFLNCNMIFRSTCERNPLFKIITAFSHRSTLRLYGRKTHTSEGRNGWLPGNSSKQLYR